MKNIITAISVLGLLVLNQYNANAKRTAQPRITKHFTLDSVIELPADSVPPAEVMDVVTKAINSLNSFNIDDVANLYTPNAVVADDEPPYSWNGPTAGVQWVNAVEQSCRDFKITKLKGYIEPVTVFQQNADNVYIVVPVSYTGNLPHKGHFSAQGAFAFVLRTINGKWMIKSQVWMSKKGVN
ncbi:MAG: hypothetical protein JWP44_3288 [Mucilaginibacter sp.]|nr:hypothetical protein [Mucilaginibacter sp.]